MISGYDTLQLLQTKDTNLYKKIEDNIKSFYRRGLPEWFRFLDMEIKKSEGRYFDYFDVREDLLKLKKILEQNNLELIEVVYRICCKIETALYPTIIEQRRIQGNGTYTNHPRLPYRQRRGNEVIAHLVPELGDAGRSPGAGWCRPLRENRNPERISERVQREIVEDPGWRTNAQETPVPGYSV
jgi:hypothetical protein